MAATGKPKFYWDTAPLIAWITDMNNSNTKKNTTTQTNDYVDELFRNTVKRMLSTPHHNQDPKKKAKKADK